MLLTRFDRPYHIVSSDITANHFKKPRPILHTFSDGAKSGMYRHRSVTLSSLERDVKNYYFNLKGDNKMKDFLSITVDDELDFSSVSERKDKFILLNEGYYSFRVLGVNMDRYQGSENSKSCPVAKLLLSIENDKGNVVLNHFFFLNNSSTQQIADFFESIGQPLTGRCNPDWDATVGLSGGCYLTQKELTYRTINKVKRFVPASKPNLERKEEPWYV